MDIRKMSLYAIYYLNHKLEIKSKLNTEEAKAEVLEIKKELKELYAINWPYMKSEEEE